MPRPLDAYPLVLCLDEGSISAAARKAGITQPAMSAWLRRSEAAAGEPLVIRGSPLRATKLGLRIYESASNYYRLAASLVRRSAEDKDYTFCLGGSEHVRKQYMPDILREIRRQAGAIRFKWRTCRQHEMEEPLLSGDIDIVIGGLSARLSSQLDCHKIVSLELVLLVPNLPEFARIHAAESLWRQGTVSHPLIQTLETELIMQVFRHQLRLRKVKWDFTGHLDSLEGVKQLVEEGAGIGVCYNLPSLVRSKRFRVIRLPGFPTVDFGLIWNRATNEHCGPALKGMKHTAAQTFHLRANGQVVSERKSAAR
jgi:DNA-binding transcriptional LysR family regulator